MQHAEKRVEQTDVVNFHRHPSSTSPSLISLKVILSFYLISTKCMCCDSAEHTSFPVGGRVVGGKGGDI